MCFWLFTQEICLAFSLALLNAGSNMAARIAIIAITTSNSINVNFRCTIFVPFCFCFQFCFCIQYRFFICHVIVPRFNGIRKS